MPSYCWGPYQGGNVIGDDLLNEAQTAKWFGAGLVFAAVPVLTMTGLDQSRSGRRVKPATTRSRHRRTHGKHRRGGRGDSC